MSPLHCLQFFLFSACVHVVTLFSYIVFFSDRLHSKDVQQEYDYVIVGSGTAGSLIAHRLATETNYTFIVLEAGAHSHALLDTPVLGPFLHRTVFDWQCESVPQTHACRAMEHNKCRLPQGKIVGGSSKLNNMIHFRGNTSHYVHWFQGKHTKEYINKQFEYIETKILHLNNVQYKSELSDAILEAAKELGYQKLLGDFDQGFMKPKVSQKNGRRWTTFDNLMSKHVVSNALVESIIFNCNTAIGVNVEIFDKKYKIRARKGVILSAGAINSPKILQLSGIGPENVLTNLGIPVVEVLPVGKNLQDHVATGLDLVHLNRSVSIEALDMVNPVNVIHYFWNGKGPMTTSGCEAIGFVSTKNDNIPDVQFMVLPVGLSSDRGSLFRKNLGIRDDIWQKYFTKSFDKYVATILPLVLHPKSKGEVYITSTDPNNPPVFNPKYLSNKDDTETLVRGLKVMMKLIKTEAMEKLGAHLNPTPFPGCEDFHLFSDSYFECYIKHLTLTSYHPVGTCSMVLPDQNGVVDNNFRVLRVNKLYVVDASVLPTLPSGNINAAVAMMASVFFDTNIANTKNDKISLCSKIDFLYDSIFNVCAVR